MPTPCLMASAGVRIATLFPSRRMWPLSAGWKPDRIFMSVLLPAPFSPKIPWIVPAGTVRADPVVRFDGPEVLVDIGQSDFHVSGILRVVS